jgi:hypothetical protein
VAQLDDGIAHTSVSIALPHVSSTRLFYAQY